MKSGPELLEVRVYMATRDLLLVGATSLLPQAAAIFGSTLALLFLGWVLYRLAMPILIERIGN